MVNAVTVLPAGRLPDIELYGGDTAPWALEVTNEQGRPLTTASLTGCTFELNATPYGVSTTMGVNGTTIAPVLTLTGSLQSSLEGYAVASFTFPAAQTINMRGKYIYQIEITKGTEKRVLQGKMLVKQNIDR